MKSSTARQVSVLDLEGELDHNNLAEIRNVIHASIARRVVDIVVNLSQVPRLDFTTLGVLVEEHGKLREHAGALRLAGLSPYLVDLIRLMGAEGFFESYTTVEEALAGIQRSRAMRH